METLPINKRHDAWLLPPCPLDSPTDVLINYDTDVREGLNPYPWQVAFHDRWGRELASEDDIIKEAVVANNGSGKSQFLIAPAAYWIAATYPDALVVITTSSHDQMDRQTERYLRRLCDNANLMHNSSLPKPGMWTCIRRRMVNNLTGSRIDLFVTDEPGKAEGSHPLRPNGRMALIVDEAKSVPDTIFEALDRCNGTSHKLLVSSPGLCRGRFYGVAVKNKGNYQTTFVTVKDCPHIRKSEIEDVISIHGLNSPLVQSSLFAKFMPDSTEVVITTQLFEHNKEKWDDLDYNLTHTLVFPSRQWRAGLDLSRGGDETVLSIWRGNIQMAIHTFKIQNSLALAKEIASKLRGYPKLLAENVRADDGGVGAAILDALHAEGYTVKRIHNQSRARRKKSYGNIGAEMWFNLKRWMEEGLIKFLPDAIQETQLCNRVYKYKDGDNDGRPFLQPKKEAKAQGLPSPDRGDAAALAWVFEIYPFEYDKAQDAADAKKAKPRQIIRTQEDLEEAIARNEQRTKERRPSNMIPLPSNFIYNKRKQPWMISNR